MSQERRLVLAASTPDADELARLLELPSVERVHWFGRGQAPRQLFGPEGDTGIAWLALASAFLERAAPELGLEGETPRISVTTWAAHLLVLGFREDGVIGLLVSDPSALGLCVVKIRQWLDGEWGRT